MGTRLPFSKDGTHRERQHQANQKDDKRLLPCCAGHVLRPGHQRGVVPALNAAHGKDVGKGRRRNRHRSDEPHQRAEGVPRDQARGNGDDHRSDAACPEDAYAPAPAQPEVGPQVCRLDQEHRVDGGIGSADRGVLFVPQGRRADEHAKSVHKYSEKSKPDDHVPSRLL